MRACSHPQTRTQSHNHTQTRARAQPFCAAACRLLAALRYLGLMRRIQTTYWLEPAGSHGVWGLDDYQFLPFVWGAGQMAGQALLKPKSIHNEELLDAYGEQYMYLAAVKFVKAVRRAALRVCAACVCAVGTCFRVHSGLAVAAARGCVHQCIAGLPHTHSADLLLAMPTHPGQEGLAARDEPHAGRREQRAELGQGQCGHDQDVPGGGAVQVPHHAALLVWQPAAAGVTRRGVQSRCGVVAARHVAACRSCAAALCSVL